MELWPSASASRLLLWTGGVFMCFCPGLSLLIGCRHSCHNVTANRQTLPILQLGQNQKAQVAEFAAFQRCMAARITLRLLWC